MTTQHHAGVPLPTEAEQPMSALIAVSDNYYTTRINCDLEALDREAATLIKQLKQA